MAEWLGGLLLLALCIWWASRRGKQMSGQSLERTMVSLVKCTQTGVPVTKEWSVSISDDMREKLYYPLTHDLVHMISTAKETPQVSRFEYRCIRHEMKKDVVTGTVEANIDYVNESNGLDLHFRNVLVTMEWRLAQGGGWFVSAVES